MALKIYNNLDMQGLEISAVTLRNAIVDPLGSLPTFDAADEGRIVSTGVSLYFNDGTQWVDVTTMATATVVDAAAGTPAISVSYNGTETYTIDVAEATISESGLLSAADKTLLANATDAATASTLALRDAEGQIQVSDAVDAGDAVNKGQLDSAVQEIHFVSQSFTAWGCFNTQPRTR